MKAITALLAILLGSSLCMAEEPCEKVKSVLIKSEYFKHMDSNQNLLGYVMFQSTPIARVMYFSSNGSATVVAKNDQGNIISPLSLVPMN